ncbi:hypothetical protein [Labrenzia sp. THAF35]|uniref:hypothetical protein n=1 Tax=Labrenzia sp. THAF35 TaxID=2587854 RepID=UPI001AD8BFF3|nr:hypothetical protein [Labrenzia sp. THAF35]
MFEQAMRLDMEEQAQRDEQSDLQFQDYVKPWMLACFGQEIADNIIERNHRFLEEALELVQAEGCTRSEAHQLVDYVFDRPIGEPHQEVGGVMVTLAALCLAANLNMHKAGSDELKRVWKKKDQIRAKQAAKPKHSPGMISVKETVEKRTLRTGRVEYTIQLEIGDGECVRDIIAFEFDRKSLSSFRQARDRAYWLCCGLSQAENILKPLAQSSAA